MDKLKVIQNEEGQATALPPSKPFEEKTLQEIYADNVPPQLPCKLPKLVKSVTSETPFKFKPTVAQAMFPPLSIYPRKLEFIYLDNQPRELRSNCLVVGGTGDGKDTCTRQPINHILADAKQRDEINRVRLAGFNAEYNRASANAQKPQRPEDLVIQTIKSDVTRAALYQRMDEAQGAPLYIRMNELEQMDKLEGSTGRNNQFTVLKLADDEGNDFGADRAGTQSVTVSGCLFLNWNANTTVGKCLRYFQYVLTDGPISRLSLATVPLPEIGSKMPVFGKYDQRYDDKLRPYIQNLKQATGTIKCQKALQMAATLKEECDDFAILTQDRVFDNLTHRALVHAFRKGCLLYAANGMKWESTIFDFCRWSLHYDLWLKMRLFGDAIRKDDAGFQVSKHGPKSLLDELPTDADGVFTFEALSQLRVKKGMDANGTAKLLSKWKQRGHIEQIGDKIYKKRT